MNEINNEALQYCSSLNNKLEARFVSTIKPYGPDRIGKSKAGYVFNSGGFRSDEFVPCSKDIPSVLFAGCSLTFGAGIELEKTYAHRIYRHLAEKGEASGFFNIATPGSSSIQAMLTIFDYINLYGNPSTIILLMPQLERDAAFLLNYKFEIDYKTQRPAPEQFSDFNRFLPLFYRIYKTLYFYCKNNNIRLISSHWHETDMMFQGKRDIEDFDTFTITYWLHKDFGDSYQGFMNDEFNKLIYDYQQSHKNERSVLRADDDDHPGTAWHYAVSQSFINKFGL